MTNIISFLAASAAIGTLAAPAAAQYYPQQPAYPQQYPQYQQQYPQGYGYNGQTGNPVTTSSIACSATAKRYGPPGGPTVRQRGAGPGGSAIWPAIWRRLGGGYNNGYRQQGYVGTNLRVTSITEVQRRSNGLRVSGTLGSGVAMAASTAINMATRTQGQGYGQLAPATSASAATSTIAAR